VLFLFLSSNTFTIQSNALIFSGNSTFNNNVVVNGTITSSSDDRLKHNEIPVSKALETIEKVNVMTYDKTKEFKDIDYKGDI
jgi:hypothetical protein